MNEPYDDDPAEEIRLCGCGCDASDHTLPARVCRYCGPEECGGFTYDEEASILALILPSEIP